MCIYTMWYNALWDCRNICFTIILKIYIWNLGSRLNLRLVVDDLKLSVLIPESCLCCFCVTLLAKVANKVTRLLTTGRANITSPDHRNPCQVSGPGFLSSAVPPGTAAFSHSPKTDVSQLGYLGELPMWVCVGVATCPGCTLYRLG